MKPKPKKILYCENTIGWLTEKLFVCLLKLRKKATKMKYIFIIIIITILSLKSIGQTNCSISNHYNDFIKIHKLTSEGHTYLSSQVVQTNKSSCFSNLINNNTSFIDYLLTNFFTHSNYKSHLKLKDSNTLNNAYILDLKNSRSFDSIMIELVSKTVEKTTPKDTVSFDEIMNIAVKYFLIKEITEDDYYAAQICTGNNAIKKTEKERKPFIEAFCFSSIFKHYDGEEYNMHEELVNTVLEIYKVNLGISKNEKLLRAQGGMFLLMRSNENLKKMLKSEYEKNKEFLPFILNDK